jgi:hypothetical protein
MDAVLEGCKQSLHRLTTLTEIFFFAQKVADIILKFDTTLDYEFLPAHIF